MTYHLRHIAAGGAQTILPDWNGLSFSALFSDVGSVSFDYAVDGAFANLIVDQAEVAVFDDDGEVPDTRAIVEGLNTEPYVVGGRTYFKVTCRTLWKFLAEGAVYNDGYPNNPGKRVYAAATAGAMLDGTLRKAGAMNEIQGLTWTFDATQDSFGNPWPTTLYMEIELGVPILQFVQTLVDQGAVEVRMQGRTIVAAAPDKLGVDRTAGSNPTVLWAGQSAMEAPEQTSSTEIRTVAIVKGDNGAIAEVADATAVARYGRRPIFVNASGVTDNGTLRVIGQRTLTQRNDVRRQRTYRYPIRPGLPVPMRGILPGDWIGTDASSTAAPTERMRAMQVSIEADSANSDGVCTLTLNDLFLDRDIRLARQVAGITGGATGSSGLPGSDGTGGGSGEEDTLRPGQVIGLTVSSSAYDTPGGINAAQITALWSPVTQNVDGSNFDDFDHYDVQWRYSNAAADEWSLNMQTPQVRLSWSPVLTGRNVQVRVRAVDRNGNTGDWSETKTVFTASDTTPPPKPSKPVLTPWLGGARAYWDGKGAAGEAMPGDFAFVEVHLSASASFTPSASTLYMTTPVGGYTPLVDLSYSDQTWVRFVAVDLASPPNKSAPSDAVSVQAERLVAEDVADAAITAAKVADNAIIVGKIANGAVSEAKLAANAVTVDKVASGAITSTKIADDAITTPKLATGAVTAAEIAAGTITASEIATGAITTRTIAANAVTAAEMRAGTITASSGILGDLAVTNAKIADAAINNAKIADATIQSAKIASLSVGKLTAGYLSADITLGSRIATSLSGARVEMNYSGIQAWNSSGTRTVNITSDGDADIVGTFRSGARNGRRLIVSAMLCEAGAGGANQAGMVFNSGNFNLRDSQIYDTGNYMRIDSPAFDASPYGQGTTLDIGRDAIRGYVRGGAAAFVITNDNSVRLSGSDGGFEKYTDGSWTVGHFNEQAVYAQGNRLVLRGGVGNGGDIEFFTRQDSTSDSGSWVDFWSHGYSNTAKVYVHGLFGAYDKRFIIEHPDPAKADTLMLQHSCTEGPDQGLLYDGTERLGEDGTATVVLPDYFTHLVQDRPVRVLLGVVGEPTTAAASRVSDGSFVITGTPGADVDWLVKASRGAVETEPPRENFNLPDDVIDEHVPAGTTRTGRPRFTTRRVRRDERADLTATRQHQMKETRGTAAQ